PLRRAERGERQAGGRLLDSLQLCGLVNVEQVEHSNPMTMLTGFDLAAFAEPAGNGAVRLDATVGQNVDARLNVLIASGGEHLDALGIIGSHSLGLELRR